MIVLPGPFRASGRVDEDSPNRAPLAVDRQTLRQLEAAANLIEKRNYPEAVRQLQRVLDDPEDSWIEVPGGQAPQFQSAKQQAVDRIGRLPASARESYENEFGQMARRMLEDATSRCDRAALEEVVRRFFQTQAGYDAAYLLGNRLLDASMPLAAAAQFDRLRLSPGGRRFEPMLSLKAAYCWMRAGLAEKTLPILSSMEDRAAGTKIKIGGRAVTIPNSDSEALQWLTRVMGPSAAPVAAPAMDWPMFGGNPARNAEATSALPLGDPAWTHSMIRDSNFREKNRFDQIETVLQEYERELADHGVLTIPATDPLVVGNKAIFRTLARLRAVDIRTGERLWDFTDRDRLYGILAAAKYPTRGGNRLPVNLEVNEPGADLRLFLNARSFRDMTYGSLSSDGERVFVLLDLGFLGLEENKSSQLPDALGARNQNILAAIDLASGAIQWEIGGARADRKNREHAGTFFLGCGLPFESALYCLGELDGEISLMKLDPATGKTAWSQRLVFPLGRLSHFPLRRLAGGNPSYASGVLVCPTTAGVVVGVDPSSRTLRWEYRYRINVAPEELSDPRMLWIDEPLYTGNDDSTRWLDSAPAIAEGSVLLTPRDSDELHCLNLADGTLRWKRERANRLFVAAVLEGTVVIVGRSSVEALRLSDGSAVWSQPVAISLPAGRGYRNGSLYHVPLATGELATIDLQHGRVITRSRFPSNVKPGNLVAAQNAVVMQSPAAVRGFRPTAEVEAARVAILKRKPDDPAALAARGELRLHTGQTAAGLDDLFHSLRQRPDRHTEQLAVATVLEGLRYDFASNRATAGRIEPLIVDPVQRFEFHRLMARGLEQAGDFSGALDHDLRLAEDEPLSKTLVSVGESTKVQPAQIVAPELGDLCRKAPASQRSQLRQKIEKWATQLAAGGNRDQLTRATASLRELPEDVGLRRTLVEKLSAESQRPEIVRQLTHLRASSDPGAAGYATARLARLMIDHQRAEEALFLLKDLEDRYRGVICADGKTGAELVHAWRSERAVKNAQSRLSPWPATHVSVKREEEDRAPRAIMPVPLEQHTGPFFRQWRFESHQHGGDRGSTLVAYDETGTERWKFELDPAHFGAAAMMDPPVAVRARGPLLEITMHRRFAVLDAFEGNSPPRLLWTRSLFDPHASAGQNRSEIGIAGLITDDFVFYQIGSILRCADSISGNVVWERRSVPSSYVLQGDDDFVIAISRSEPNEPSGLVLRTATGAEVLSGAFGIAGPLSNDWKGRRVFTTAVGPSHLSLAILDLVQRGKTVWSRSYPVPAWTTPIDDEEFAVFDSRGMLHIHSYETGAAVMETAIQGPGAPQQVAVRRVGNRYLVISQGSAVRFPGFRDIPHGLPGGKICAIDRDSGKEAWSISMPIPQTLLETSAQSPVLVFVRPLHRFESVRSNGEEILSILDARTGGLLYEVAETTPPDRINVRLEREQHQVIVATDKCQLKIVPTDVPLTSPPPPAPVEAIRPAPKR
jgi:outer membrane protein assembly factor BamB